MRTGRFVIRLLSEVALSRVIQRPQAEESEGVARRLFCQGEILGLRPQMLHYALNDTVPKHLFRWAFCILLTVGCLLSASAQSPWARSKAGFYAQAAYHAIPAYGTLFGKNGSDDIEMEREVSENTIQFYGEYGLNRKTTLVAALPLVFNRRGDVNPASQLMFAQEDSGSIAGLGNVQLAVRHQFRAGKVALAGTLRVGLPAAAGYEKNTDLRTGYAAFTVLPTVSAGMGLRRAYWFAYGGYGLRTNDYSHLLNVGAEAGWHFKKVWLIGFSELVFSLENGSRRLPTQDVLSGLYVNDQGYWSLGLKAIVEMNRFWGLTASAAGAGWGQYVPKRPGLGLGAYFRWD